MIYPNLQIQYFLFDKSLTSYFRSHLKYHKMFNWFQSRPVLVILLGAAHTMGKVLFYTTYLNTRTEKVNQYSLATGKFFVRKMVCQDDNAPEVGSSSTNISLKCLLKVSSLHSLLYQPHHNLENYRTTKKSRQNASKTICFSTSKASLFRT